MHVFVVPIVLVDVKKAWLSHRQAFLLPAGLSC
jgi:hypothetical protein